ncbi:MAG: HIT domain-containing protein [Phycisphaerales bacterium]
MCEVVRQGAGHAMHVATLDETVVILGENQGCAGWCVSVLREHVEHMDEMDISRQERVFREVARVARAVRAASVQHGWGRDVQPPRINYECLGNVVGHVHWHVVPRHADDPTPRATVWGWSAEQLRGDASDAERVVRARAIRSVLV